MTNQINPFSLRLSIDSMFVWIVDTLGREGDVQSMRLEITLLAQGQCVAKSG